MYLEPAAPGRGQFSFFSILGTVLRMEINQFLKNNNYLQIYVYVYVKRKKKKKYNVIGGRHASCVMSK